jgi:hypothetical protein
MRLALVILGGALAATAQEDHSQHQHPVAGLGTVNFSTSCNARAQPLMSRGAAMLHSFGYEEARITFQDAAKADPACGMAHWGVARTWYHPIWAPPSPDELKKGAAALDLAVSTGAKTERERDYINSLAVFYKDWQTVGHSTRVKNYEQALAKVAERNRDDDEAAIFHALQLVAIGYLDPTDKTYTWQKKGAEILNRLLPRHRTTPASPTTSFTVWITRPPRSSASRRRARTRRSRRIRRTRCTCRRTFSRDWVFGTTQSSPTLPRRNRPSRRRSGCMEAAAHSTSSTPSITWCMPFFSRRRTCVRESC